MAFHTIPYSLYDNVKNNVSNITPPASSAAAAAATVKVVTNKNGCALFLLFIFVVANVNFIIHCRKRSPATLAKMTLSSFRVFSLLLLLSRRFPGSPFFLPLIQSHADFDC